MKKIHDTPPLVAGNGQGGDRCRLAPAAAETCAHRQRRPRYARAILVLLTVLAASPGARADAGALAARHHELATALAGSAFQQPVVLQSAASDERLAGDIHAVLRHGFRRARAALAQAPNWCDILILHPNVKQCLADGAGETWTLAVRLGRKSGQMPDEAEAVVFDHRVTAVRPDYLEVTLSAESGPLGTHDYDIVLQAIPLPDGTTFLHLSYAYGYGLMARLAMQTYLSTVGRDKIGFSITGYDGDGRPIHVRGMRGVVERNTMRYYLAIDAFLASVSAPSNQQTRLRLRHWFMATERYRPQLQEADLTEYLAMKRRELRLQHEARQRQG